MNDEQFQAICNGTFNGRILNVDKDVMFFALIANKIINYKIRRSE